MWWVIVSCGKEKRDEVLFLCFRFTPWESSHLVNMHLNIAECKHTRQPEQKKKNKKFCEIKMCTTILFFSHCQSNSILFMFFCLRCHIRIATVAVFVLNLPHICCAPWQRFALPTFRMAKKHLFKIWSIKLNNFQQFQTIFACFFSLFYLPFLLRCFLLLIT